MGWLDKGFKNIVKGGKDLLSSPAGILLLSAAAPWLSKGMAGSGMLKGLSTGKMGSLLTSPWVSNALKNAAIQGGISTLTRSKHPWKSMGYAALGSMPFTAMQSAQAANTFNVANPNLKDKAKWWEFALGQDKTVPGKFNYEDIIGSEMIDDPSFIKSGDLPVGVTQDVPQIENIIQTPHYSLTQGPSKKFDLGDELGSYFMKGKSLDKFAENKGLAGLYSALAGPVDIPAAVLPQIAGMYGGRMTDEEKWLASQEKQIRLWAFQHGIPYEEAKEIWKDGYRNPYYQTRTPKDYNFQFNKGGSVPYKDDYTAGGSAVGPGTGTSDSIRPVALSDGEFVFTEEATNNFPGGHEGLYSLMNSLDPNSERAEEARV